MASSSSHKSKTKVPASVCNGTFQIGKKLGSGCFGEVYKGLNTETRQEVAIKLEATSGNAPQLEHEAGVLNILRSPVQPQGFTEYYFFGNEGLYRCLVMECLGKSLEDHVQACGRKFTVKTTVLLADQILQRIEYFHSKGMVHRDIKSENFMMGHDLKCHHVYLIDFGLSKKYYEKDHSQMKTNLSLTGTARYASINAHRGIEQSRRDDLEAIGHMLLYFIRGSLPWSGLDAKTKQEKYRKIKEKKEQTPTKDLCQGFPQAFQSYLELCRGLQFKDRPNYDAMRKSFLAVRDDIQKQDKEKKVIQDWDFEFLESENLVHGEKEGRKIVPLDRKEGILQPDDSRPKGGRGRGFCLCGSKKIASE